MCICMIHFIHCRRSEYLPRIITIIATDESGANSEPAVVRINFLSVDNNPPMVDLNGPLVSGLNHSTTFNEGSTTGIPVRKCVNHFTIIILYVFYRLLARMQLLEILIQINSAF